MTRLKPLLAVFLVVLAMGLVPAALAQEDTTSTPTPTTTGTPTETTTENETETNSTPTNTEATGTLTEAQGENETNDTPTTTEADSGQTNTSQDDDRDKILYTLGGGAVVVQDVREYNNKIEVDIKTNRYQSVGVVKSYGNSWTTETRTVGSGEHTLIIEDISGVDNVGLSVNGEGRWLGASGGTSILPDSVPPQWALGIGSFVVFLGLYIKAKRREQKEKNKVEQMR